MLFLAIFNRLGKKKRAEKPLADLKDEELLERFGAGDAKAFEGLMNRYNRGIYNYILRFVGSRDRAEDLLQEVFLRVVRSAPDYQLRAKFSTWLYTIARNLCIDVARKGARYSEVSLDRSISKDSDDDRRTFLDSVEDRHTDDGSTYTRRQEFRRQLHSALQELPDEQREVFLLRELSGLKFREIAAIIGVPENTVKSRMRYTLQTLRGHLEVFKGEHIDREQVLT